MVEYDFTLDSKTTAALVEQTPNIPLASKIHGCLLHSFAQVFKDRPVPTVFVESHGREPWNKDIDLTRTVGWFTTLWPAYVSIQREQSISDVIRKTQESRNSVPSNGWAYFASRYLSPEGRSAFHDTGPFELTFNHGGTMQSAHESNAILELDSQGMTSRRQARDEMVRFALLEVNSVVFDGSLRVKFGVNRGMKQADTLQRWVQECEQSLQAAAAASLAHSTETASISLSGHPLVNMATQPLKDLMQAMSIEDVYPCTPAQRGILLSQLRNPRLYNTLWTIEVSPTHGHAAVNLQKLQVAWAQVISRHAALRTILVSFPNTEFAQQVVLKDFEPSVSIITDGIVDAISRMQELTNQRKPDSWTPAPQVAILQQAGGAVCIGLSISHAFFDATSIELLMRDMRLAYDGQLSLENPPRFKDFVDHVQAETRAAARALQYWTDYLRGIEPCHLLSGPDSDHDNPNVRTVSIDLVDSNTLQSFCSEQGLLVTNILHVAWALVLRCYTGMDDVCFSFVTSGRDMAVPGIQDCIGLFVNPLVGRLAIPGDATVLQLLELNQRALVNSLGHQDFSLSNAPQLTQAAGRPVFDTGISVRRDLPAGELPNASTALKVVDSHVQTEYPLLVDVALAADKARVSLVYWESVLPDAQAATIAHTFRQVVQEMLRDPTQPIRALDMVPQESKDRITQWNQPQPLESWELIHTEIMRCATETPDAPAICAWDGSMTYQELNHRSSILAVYLINQGAGPEVFVPVCLEKSVWVPVAVCAVLKAGAAFCLLDVSFPPQRLQSMCHQLGASMVLTSARNQDLAEHLGTPIIVSTHSGPDNLDNAPPVPNLGLFGSPDHAAYVVFTSGSTGHPKAAVIDHQAACASIRGQVSPAVRTSTARVFQFSSHAFDVATNDILASLMTGACLCIPSEQDRLSNLAESARRFKITYFNTTPSVARLLSPNGVPTLETIAVGGETPTEGDIAKWGSLLIIMYGPAECCMAATIRNPVVLAHGTRSIGWALPSTRTWIVDQHDFDRLIPVGAVGELLIEGTSIGRGYHHAPEKTQQSFLVDPPAWRRRFNLPGKVHRFYRTGDLACYLPDGSLHFLGRQDSQVKVRGQRLELAEVEHHVAQAFPSAPHVVVDLIKPATGSQEPILMAFIGQDSSRRLPASSSVDTSADDLFMAPSAPFLETVRSALSLLRDRLPAFMVPVVFMPLITIPMTAGGKIDRRSIRTRAAQLRSDETASHSTDALSKCRPATTTEAQLHAVISRVLNIEPDLLGVGDDLFQRGLDSIQAMKLVSMAKQKGIVLAVPDIFAHPQISALAVVVNETKGSEHADTDTDDDSLALPGSLMDVADYGHLVKEITAGQPYDSADVEDVLPTTSFQREYLEAMYSAYFVFRFPSTIDSTKLTGAVQSVFRKYSILRTAFVPFQNTILQVILRADAGTPVLLERPLDDASDFPAAIFQTCQDDCNSQRCLPAGPYFQATLVREPSGQSALLMRLNHAQFDRLSASSLFQDLSAAYDSLSLRSAPKFRDVLAHRSRLHTRTAFHFWEGLLEGSSMTEIGSHGTDDHTERGPATWIEQERKIPFTPGPSRFTVATMHKAAWALTLAQETKSRDLVFGQVANGRNTTQDGIEDVLGPYANPVPVRVTLQPTWTVEDLLQHIQSQHVRAMEFETVDCEDIVKSSTPWPQDTSFGSVIQYQNIPLQEDVKFSNLAAVCETHQFNVPCRTPHLTSRFTDSNTLSLSLSGSRGQFDEDQVNRLLTVFGEMLGLLATDIHQSVENIL